MEACFCLRIKNKDNRDISLTIQTFFRINVELQNGNSESFLRRKVRIVR